MHIMFNANEIFEIAVQIERNGADFYRRAAENASDPGVKQELLDLAAMEDTHVETFSGLKEELAEGQETEWFDPENEAALYLQNFAAGNVFDLTKDTSGFLTPQTSLREILEYAIERERDSVVFYVGVKELVPPHLGSGKIETIIKQEMGHVTQLSRRLKELAA